MLSLVIMWSIAASGCTSSKLKFGKLNTNNWSYNENSDVFYQTELLYCKDPTDTDYQTLSVFVPGEYFNAVRNADEKYECKINEYAKSGEYTYKTAPIVFDIRTIGYNSSLAPTDYLNQAIVYTQRGYIYVTAGCRGIDEGAPYGVTDLKAAIRYLRYIDKDCPGDAEKIYAMGASGGASGMAAVLGTSGDSPLYDKYLEKIGAVSKYSDSVYGVICWSPNTCFDTADAAYEWNMGATREKLTDEEKRISAALSDEYVKYLNALKLKNGKTLLSINKDNGGTYPEYLKSVIEDSLNHFIHNARFPYEAKAITDGFGTVAAKKNDKVNTDSNGNINLPEDNFDDESESVTGNDNILRGKSTSKLNLTGTYDSVREYIDALNKNKEWVKYDSKSNTVTITGVDDFVQQMKGATRGMAAFDSLDKKQAENKLFATKGKPRHFDTLLAGVMKSNDKYADAFTADSKATDDIGTDTATRVNMYNPMYYINAYYAGNGTAKTAKYWRIRSGISQGDTSLCTEVNLALALEQAGADVDFLELWSVGNEKNELNGNVEINTLDWLDAKA